LIRLAISTQGYLKFQVDLKNNQRWLFALQVCEASDDDYVEIDE
jgi:hypothetical protein